MSTIGQINFDNVEPKFNWIVIWPFDKIMDRQNLTNYGPRFAVYLNIWQRWTFNGNVMKKLSKKIKLWINSFCKSHMWGYVSWKIIIKCRKHSFSAARRRCHLQITFITASFFEMLLGVKWFFVTRRFRPWSYREILNVKLRYAHF